MEKIKKITKEFDFTYQSLFEKLEIFADKINEIIEFLNRLCLKSSTCLKSPFTQQTTSLKQS